jgi:hypothetical protein
MGTVDCGAVMKIRLAPGCRRCWCLARDMKAAQQIDVQHHLEGIGRHLLGRREKLPPRQTPARR